MASIVLTAVGSTLLPGIGGTVLGALGKVAGGLIDQQLGLAPARKLVGPRLDNLKVQDSRYGAGIPLIFGKARVAGQVIWASDLIETTQEESVGGGKGGGGGASSVRYSYSVNCAIAIGQGPLARLAAAWADGKQLYDGLQWKAGLAASISYYTGDGTQMPDAVMQAALGSGQVPAYRGIAYLVFERLQLADFGNRLPNLTFEVVATTAAAAPALGANTDPVLQNVNTGFATRGGTPPLMTAGTARDARQMLVAGMQNATSANSAAAFTAVTYDVNGPQPVEIARQSSAAFSLDAALAGLTWALAPDGHTVAWLATSSASPLMQATIGFYDTVSGQFGTLVQLPVKSLPRSLVWLDALHVAFVDHDGSALGVQVLTRAGLNPVGLGFTPVWGAGSATTRFPVGTAQFVALPNGVLMVAGNAGVSPSILYGCFLAWDDNRLTVGSPYTLAGGVPALSLNRADIIAMGDGEYLFVFRKVDRLVLCSFVPAAARATLTRGWQTMMLSIVSDDTGIGWHGAHLAVLQRLSYETHYRLSEITLTPTGFALSTDAVSVTGNALGGGYYQPFALDDNRMLVQGGDAFGLDFAELRILSRTAGGASLQTIAGALLRAAGYEALDTDLTALGASAVTGYSVQPPLTARAALEPLLRFGAFDLIESDDQIKAVPRHALADVVVSVTELRATRDVSKSPPALSLRRSSELELPRVLTVDYLDPAQDFEVGSQQAQRHLTQSSQRAKVNLPVICNADAARRVAEAQLYGAWAERTQVKFSVAQRYLMLEPSDVVAVDGAAFRIQQIQQAGGLLDITAVPNYVPPAAASAPAEALSARVAAPLSLSPPIVSLCDLPPLAAVDADQPGFYTALSAASPWPGGVLWRAADNVNYSVAATVNQAATAGIATSVLAASTADYPDSMNSVTVQLWRGSLASHNAEEVLAGANAALLGDEIIQFQSVTLLGNGAYQLRNLLRGRRGTEAAVSTHGLGERFLLLSPETLHFVPLTLGDRGLSQSYKAVTVGQNLAEATARSFTAGLRTLQPWAPAQLQGTRAAGTGSDFTLGWVRRARRDNGWHDAIDVPLDESSERYDLEIYDASNNLKRTVRDLTQPTYIYTAAQQSADFAVIPATFTVAVYQVSDRYGRGVAARATL